MLPQDQGSGSFPSEGKQEKSTFFPLRVVHSFTQMNTRRSMETSIPSAWVSKVLVSCIYCIQEESLNLMILFFQISSLIPVCWDCWMNTRRNMETSSPFTWVSKSGSRQRQQRSWCALLWPNDPTLRIHIMHGHLKSVVTLWAWNVRSPFGPQRSFLASFSTSQRFICISTPVGLLGILHCLSHWEEILKWTSKQAPVQQLPFQCSQKWKYPQDCVSAFTFTVKGAVPASRPQGHPCQSRVRVGSTNNNKDIATERSAAKNSKIGQNWEPAFLVGVTSWELLSAICVSLLSTSPQKNSSVAFCRFSPCCGFKQFGPVQQNHSGWTEQLCWQI